MQKAAHAYLQAKVATTSPGDILIMLYDGAINFLQSAKERIADGDVAGKGILISKALDILNELDSTLNLEKGGDLAVNLHNLYFFCNSRLLMANLKKDPRIIDEVIKVLSGLRSAYAEINATPEGMAAAREAAANQHARAVQPIRPGGQPQGPAAGKGPLPASGAAAMPGAGARARTLYARQAADVSASGATPETPGEAAPVSFVPEAAAASFGTASPASPAASLGAASPAASSPASAAPVPGLGGAISANQFAAYAARRAAAQGAAPQSVQSPAAASAYAAQAPAAASPASGAAASASVAPAPAQQAPAVPPQAETEQATQPLLSARPGTGFSRMAGTELYRKFAG